MLLVVLVICLPHKQCCLFGDCDIFVDKKFAGVNERWLAWDLHGLTAVERVSSGKDSFMCKILHDAGGREKGRYVCFVIKIDIFCKFIIVPMQITCLSIALRSDQARCSCLHPVLWTQKGVLEAWNKETVLN